MLGHSEPLSVAAYASLMFAKTTPKASSSSTNVKKRPLAVGYLVKILGLAGEIVMDRKGTLTASYLSDETDVIVAFASWTLTAAR